MLIDNTLFILMVEFYDASQQNVIKSNNIFEGLKLLCTNTLPKVLNRDIILRHDKNNNYCIVIEDVNYYLGWKDFDFMEERCMKIANILIDFISEYLFKWECNLVNKMNNGEFIEYETKASYLNERIMIYLYRR